MKSSASRNSSTVGPDRTGYPRLEMSKKETSGHSLNSRRNPFILISIHCSETVLMMAFKVTEKNVVLLVIFQAVQYIVPIMLS